MKYIKLYENFSPKAVKDDNIIKGYIDSATELQTEDIERVISLLERDCPEFLNELKNKHITPLFRGTHKSIKDIEEVKTDKFRIPKDLDMSISNTFNDCFRAIFGVPIRSQGVFATKSPYVTQTYGTTKMFFPIGNYRYFWNPDVDDLYTYVDENLSDDIDDDDVKSKPKQKQETTKTAKTAKSVKTAKTTKSSNQKKKRKSSINESDFKISIY